MNTKQTAINLLKDVLMQSSVENEFDQAIYEFLKGIGELPKGYIPYWESDNEQTSGEKLEFIGKVERILHEKYHLHREKIESEISIETFDNYYNVSTPEKAAKEIYNELFKQSITSEVRKFIEKTYSIPDILETLGYYDGSMSEKEIKELEQLENTPNKEKEFVEKVLDYAQVNGNFIEAYKGNLHPNAI